jgi:hypothetical protein
MAGTEGAHSGSHDLLRQATQAVMSRYVQGYALLLQPESIYVFHASMLFL